MKKFFYIIGIVSFVLFVLIAVNYKNNIISIFDQRMSDLVFGNNFIIFFHYFGETKLVIAISAILIIILFVKKHYSKIFLVVSSVGIGALINQVIKKIVKRERPEIVDQLSSFSFPSAHSMLGLLYIFVLCYLITENIDNRITKLIIWLVGVILVVLIGLSRVAESRHFASDVLAGWLLSFAWFTFCVYIYRKIKKQKL